MRPPHRQGRRMLAVRIANPAPVELPRTEPTNAAQRESPPCVADDHKGLAVRNFAGGNRRGIACIHRGTGGEFACLFARANVYPADVGSSLVKRSQEQGSR